MQALPKLQQIWPGHWIFHTLDIFTEPVGDPGRDMIEAWMKFAAGIIDKVIDHYESQKIAGTMPSQVQPFELDKVDVERAAALPPGVFGEWCIKSAMVDPAADPCTFAAMNMVWLA